MKSFQSLLFLLLALQIGFARRLLSCQQQRLLFSSKLAQHLLLFIFIFFTIVYSKPDGRQPSLRLHLLRSIAKSAWIYFFFLLLSKTHLPIFIFALILLSIHLFLVDYRDDYAESSTPEERERLTWWIRFVTMLFYLTTGFGFILYMVYQQKTYGKKFNWSTFLLGTHNCSGITS